jgi:hypothetical protein
LVVVRTALFPYNESSHWCFKNFEPSIAKIINRVGKQIEYLRHEDVSGRYHFPRPTCVLNENFLKGFAQNNKGPAKFMKNYWVDEEKVFKQGKKLIPTQGFKSTYKMLITMLNRLCGEEKCTHFHTN